MISRGNKEKFLPQFFTTVLELRILFRTPSPTCTSIRKEISICAHDRSSLFFLSYTLRESKMSTGQVFVVRTVLYVTIIQFKCAGGMSLLYFLS
jgi:hypothetical protein